LSSSAISTTPESNGEEGQAEAEGLKEGILLQGEANAIIHEGYDLDKISTQAKKPTLGLI
jgi:hypothetical protein